MSLRLPILIFVLLVPIQSLACDFNNECQGGQVCCNYKCVTGNNCYGQPCTSDPQCGDQPGSAVAACCSKTCVRGSSCKGRKCTDSDSCSPVEVCRAGYCRDFRGDDSLWATTLIITAAVFVTGVVVCVSAYYICARWERRRIRAISNRGEATYGTRSDGNQTWPPRAQNSCEGLPPGDDFQPNPTPRGGQRNRGFEGESPARLKLEEEPDDAEMPII